MSMERKGFWSDYAYMGYVNGTYLPFVNEAEYHQYLNGEKPTGSVLKARKEQMRKVRKAAADRPAAKDLVTYFEARAEAGMDEPLEADMVNHPPHYQSKSGLEVIDVIAAFTDGLNGVEASTTANIIKYACRWKKKNGVEDLKKIVWYANYLINYLEGKENK